LTITPPPVMSRSSSSQSYLDGSNGLARNGTRWSFNEQGILIGSNNPIVDGIQQRQARDSRSTSLSDGSVFSHVGSLSMSRRGSMNDVLSSQDNLWIQQQQQQQQIYQPHPNSPTSRFAIPTMLARDPLGVRGLSMISPVQPNLANANRLTYPNHQPNSSFDRAAAAAQLSSYFGPSSVEISPQAFELPLNDYATSSQHSLSPARSLISLYQTDPDDVLYVQARQTFVQQSLLALASSTRSQSLTQQQLELAYEDSTTAMMSHFDRAMHSLNPLATLYGLSDEATRSLLVDPESSGISPDVLRLAGMRSQAQMNSMGVAGLAGPSANNRKLGLYKVSHFSFFAFHLFSSVLNSSWCSIIARLNLVVTGKRKAVADMALGKLCDSLLCCLLFLEY
jgi:hypothetical protein